MIDVLVSIIVMAIALLALAVLQGTLTRNTADARARTLIAQLGDSLIDNAHQTGFASLTNGSTTITPAAPASPATCLNPGSPNSLTRANLAYCAQQAAAVSGLTVNQTVATYTFASKNVPNATASCTDTFVTNVGSCPTSASTPQYKNLTLTATWTDSSGTSRTLVENSIVSPLSLDTSGILVQHDYGSGAVTNPVVRTNSPAVPGVIPIAISANSNTAATNPKPELSGVTNATSYNVLTYKSLGSSQVQIQQRIETNVIACSCKYGQQLLAPNVFAPAWRPTFWDGLKYASPSPAAASLAGQNPSPPAAQSPLCTYCCRDHRDYANDLFNPKTNAYDLTDPIVYDWARSAASDPHDHYSVTGSAPNYIFTKIATGSTTPYLEAARMIRVDGLWRTATDLIAEQSGMLATDSSNSTGYPTPTSLLPATSWIPSASAQAEYQAFVKEYFNQKIVQGGTPNANNLYHSYNLDDPALLFITKLPKLYLASRGLYLDHLEVAAVKQIQSAIDHCDLSIGTLLDCVLPYVPFTSINLTEVARWTGGLLPSLPPSPSNVLTTVGGLLCDPSTDVNKCDPTKTVPKGGVVTTGSAAGQWDSVLMSISPSNRGVTTSPTPIDPGDNTLVANYPSDTTIHDPASVPAHTDIQHFKVTATAGDAFTANLVGDPLTSDGISNNDPTMNWLSNDGTDSGPCSPTYSGSDTDPNPYGCQTDLKLSTIGSPIAPMNLQVQGYTFIQNKLETDPCNSAVTTQHPYCEYYKVNRIDLNGTALGPQPTVSISNLGKTSEISQFKIPGLLANGVVTVNITSIGETGSTSQVCDTSTTPPQPVTWNPPPCQ
ncbi:MAG: hypothetical protein ABIQ78_12485 [Dokdonella sp.]